MRFNPDNPVKPIKPIIGEWYLVTTLPYPVKCLRFEGNGFYLVRHEHSSTGLSVHKKAFAIHLHWNQTATNKPEKKPQKITTAELVNKVIADFDFDRAKKVMDALDWKWASSRTETRVPNHGELVMCARRLLIDVLTTLPPSGPARHTIATGGFSAAAEQYEDGEIVLSLDFVVADTNWSTQDTCY